MNQSRTTNIDLDAMSMPELSALRDQAEAKHLEKLQRARDTVLNEARTKLTELGASSGSAPSTSAQVITERTRTIDQIKRLYAVVMGFALTSCFSNIYNCVKLIDIFSPHFFSLLAQAIVFVTLIVLFYLGAERLFDTRYLSTESRVPSRSGLLIDLFTSGSTAVWFVILADTFPDPAKYNTQEVMELALSRNVSFFTANLRCYI